MVRTRKSCLKQYASLDTSYVQKMKGGMHSSGNSSGIQSINSGYMNSGFSLKVLYKDVKCLYLPHQGQ